MVPWYKRIVRNKFVIKAENLYYRYQVLERVHETLVYAVHEVWSHSLVFICSKHQKCGHREKTEDHLDQLKRQIDHSRNDRLEGRHFVPIRTRL
jgi:hypothetical protein